MGEMRTLEEYLKENFEKDIIDFAVRTAISSKGYLRFYIHPLNAKGDTLDFMFSDNRVITINDQRN